jgi:hypothetical protein
MALRVRVLGANGALTCLNLDEMPVWRMHLTLANEELAVAIGYPGPAGLQNASLGGIPFPPKTEDLVRQVGKMALAGGSLTEDTKIAIEGVRGLVNYQGVRAPQVEEIIVQIPDLMKFAHDVRTAFWERRPGPHLFRNYQVDITMT